MRRFLRHGAAGVLAAAIAGAPLLIAVPGMAAGTRPAAAGPAGWHLAYRSASAHDTQIYGVAAVTPGDAWAVGASSGTGKAENQPLVLRWNGTHRHTVGQRASRQ